MEQTEAEFLRTYDASRYPRPSVTTDTALFACRDDALVLLLVRRGGHPCRGMWALPGGFLNMDETIAACATRELCEETHRTGLTLCPVGVYDAVGRDPRGRTISHLFWTITDTTAGVCADDDAADARWFSVRRTQDGERFTLSLAAGDVTLSATLCGSRDVCGTMHYSILQSDGLAFDHAALLASALDALTSHQNILDALCPNASRATRFSMARTIAAV